METESDNEREFKVTSYSLRNQNDLKEYYNEDFLIFIGIIELNQIEADKIFHSKLKALNIVDNELSFTTIDLINKKFQQSESIKFFELTSIDSENKLLPQLGRILERNCSRNLKTISFKFDGGISNKIIQLLVKTIPGLENIESFFFSLLINDKMFLTSSSFSNLFDLYSKIDFYFFSCDKFFDTRNSIFLTKAIKDEHYSTNEKDFLFCCNDLDVDMVSNDTSVVEYKNFLSVYLKSKHTVAFVKIESLLVCKELFESSEFLKKEFKILKEKEMIEIIGKEIEAYLTP